MLEGVCFDKHIRCKQDCRQAVRLTPVRTFAWHYWYASDMSEMAPLEAEAAVQLQRQGPPFGDAAGVACCSSTFSLAVTSNSSSVSAGEASGG